MVSKQKDNNEGYNKHTRRVIDNNSSYLHRNMARQVKEVKDAKMKKEVTCGKVSISSVTTQMDLIIHFSQPMHNASHVVLTALLL